jgi:hypothetical protein
LIKARCRQRWRIGQIGPPDQPLQIAIASAGSSNQGSYFLSGRPNLRQSASL